MKTLQLANSNSCFLLVQTWPMKDLLPYWTKLEPMKTLQLPNSNSFRSGPYWTNQSSHTQLDTAWTNENSPNGKILFPITTSSTSFFSGGGGGEEVGGEGGRWRATHSSSPYSDPFRSWLGCRDTKARVLPPLKWAPCSRRNPCMGGGVVKKGVAYVTAGGGL